MLIVVHRGAVPGINTYSRVMVLREPVGEKVREVMVTESTPTAKLGKSQCECHKCQVVSHELRSRLFTAAQK